MRDLTAKVALVLACISLGASGFTLLDSKKGPEVFGAAGDNVDHIIKRGTVQTTDATPTTLVSITIPVGTEGIVEIRAHALGVKTDASKSFNEELIATGTINGGAFGLSDQLDLGDLDVGTSTYGAQISEISSNVVGVTVSGAAAQTVRWMGRIEIDITEETMSGGG